MESSGMFSSAFVDRVKIVDHAQLVQIWISHFEKVLSNMRGKNSGVFRINMPPDFERLGPSFKSDVLKTLQKCFIDQIGLRETDLIRCMPYGTFCFTKEVFINHRENETKVCSCTDPACDSFNIHF
jgi:hypothetical protein